MPNVFAVLHEMDRNKAGGSDGLHPRMLKNFPDIVVEIVCTCFVVCLRIDEYLDSGDRGEIVPLLKALKNA